MRCWCQLLTCEQTNLVFSLLNSIRIGDTTHCHGYPEGRTKQQARALARIVASCIVYSLLVAIADHVERAAEEGSDVPEDGHTHPHERGSIFRAPPKGRYQRQKHARHQGCPGEQSSLRHLAYRLHPFALSRCSQCSLPARQRCQRGGFLSNVIP